MKCYSPTFLVNRKSASLFLYFAVSLPLTLALCVKERRTKNNQQQQPATNDQQQQQIAFYFLFCETFLLPVSVSGFLCLFN